MRKFIWIQTFEIMQVDKITVFVFFAYFNALLYHITVLLLYIFRLISQEFVNILKWLYKLNCTKNPYDYYEKAIMKPIPKPN